MKETTVDTKSAPVSTDPWHPTNRIVKSKKGKVKEGKLAPVVIWDRRQGTYNIGKNQYKRDLKALKQQESK